MIHSRPAQDYSRACAHSTDPEVIEVYLRDASQRTDGISPEIYFPRSESEVVDALKRASTLLPIGAQSSLTGGAQPFGESLLSFSAMSKIESFQVDSVTLQPGVLLHDLLDELEKRGCYYPPVPTFDGASLGGTVATDAAGAATFKYGTTRNWVEAIDIVLANGEVLELHRGEVWARDDGYFEICCTDGSRIRFQRPEIPCRTCPRTPLDISLRRKWISSIFSLVVKEAWELSRASS